MKIPKKLILFSLLLIPMISFGNNCGEQGGGSCSEDTYCVCKQHIQNNSSEMWNVSYNISTGANGDNKFAYDVGPNSTVTVTLCAEQGSDSYDAHVEVMDNQGVSGTTPLQIFGNGGHCPTIENSQCISPNVTMNSPSDSDILINDVMWCNNPPPCLITTVCPEGTGLLTPKDIIEKNH